MTDASKAVLDDADWEVPSHEVETYGPKSHRYALVIPVINEGERIRGQLTRIKEARLAVDVIVADGGSNDGSLDADFVGPIGVRAVLTKTGPGKLSAQLRMAYAWCLREGYAGVVTIDGNGKDGVEAVTKFVEKLDQGCDYVQGSRYLPGGEAENTPLERTIANRFIHAPILSFAGRRWFTDTTNGFRAYSARYLTHPQVRPFRSEFEVYNLLFYLTVRAGQLGLKVDQVPVIRRYPQSGKVPTKIGGFASKLALFGETISAATGGYTPGENTTKRGSFLWPVIVAAAVLLPLLLSIVSAPNYSPDSWALYELGKSVFSDFYRFSHFRSYASGSEYSSAFAPLWPVLIALLDGAFGTGARTGLYLAFLSFFLFSLLSERIGRQITGTRWIGLAIALVLLLGPSMVWDELQGGRTIPLQLLLYAAVLHGLLAGSSMTLLRAATIGFAAGLAVMNRFDAALLPLLTLLLVGWVTRSRLHVGAAFAASVLAISPWIAYSLSTFGSVFVTDNSAVATTLDPRAFVTDWWPASQPDWSDDPAGWAFKVASHAVQWVVNALSLLTTGLGWVFALAALFVGALQFACSKAPVTKTATRAVREQLWLLMLFVLALAVMMAPQIVTGYLEYRYYTALFWATFLAIAVWQISSGHSQRQRQFFANCMAGVIAIGLVGFVVLQTLDKDSPERAVDQNWAQFEQPAALLELKQCLGDDQNARILVMGDDRFAAKAGALGSLRTMMTPRNMAQGRLGNAEISTFLKEWEVGYLLILGQERPRYLASQSGFVTVKECELDLLKRAE